MHSESATSRIRESIRELQVQVGLDWAEWSEDDMAAALHIMNTHKVDQNAALDQTSRGPND